MIWLVRKTLALGVTLTISTCAAMFVRHVVLPDIYASPPYVVGIGSDGGGVRLPDAPLTITYKPGAARTDAADQHRTAGVVKLRMTLGRDGTVSCVMPVETLPDGLTERAVEAAKRIKFRPAIVGGQFVDTEQIVEYEFPLPTD